MLSSRLFVLFSVSLLVICSSRTNRADAEGAVNEGETCLAGQCIKKDTKVSLSNALAAFPRIQKHMLRLAADPSTRKEARFVVFRVCCGELGNRLLGLTSSFLVALLTGRGLLIDWPAIDGFSGDAYHELFEAPEGLDMLFSPMLMKWKLPVDQLNGLSKTLELNNARPEPFESVLCSDLNVIYRDTPFLVLVTNQYFAPALQHNKHTAPFVEALFKKGVRQGKSMFSQLVKYIARPQKDILEEINTFKKLHFKGKHVISIQIRRQNREGRDKKGAATSDEHVHMYWSCARNQASQARNGSIYFLATDHEPMRLEAVRQFGSSVTFYNATIQTTAQGMRSALIDLWLLGEGNDIVVTSGSTFGYVAHARKSLKPHLITLDKERGKEEWSELKWAKPSCVKETSNEPCFHVWPMMIAQKCHVGGFESALKMWGQLNCRPWDMEMLRFE